jgi:subtilisin family serine protease
VYVDPAVEQAVRNEQDAAVIVELSVELSADEQRNSESLAEAKSQLVSELPEGSVAQVRQIGSTSFVALTVSSEGLDILSQSQSVESVTLDERFEPFWSDPSEVTGADPTAWARGYTGAGRSVAIIDTGVKRSHPYFGGRVVNGACFVSSYSGYSSPCAYGTVGVEAAEPCAADHPSCYHGTHVAGIAAGANGDSGINGVAKDAQIISVQVFAECNVGDCISASTADITAALAWIFEEVKAPNPDPGFAELRAVNLSLGGGSRYYGDCDGSFPSLKGVVDGLRSVGIATVVAAGNSGWSDAVSAPACLSNVVTVGATQGATSAATGTRASYSNAGPQVDVLAPGSGILSSVGASSYGMTSGTSMAAPAVAGAIAAMEFGPSSADLDSVLGKLRIVGAGRTCVTSGDYARPALRTDVMAGADRSPLSCAPSRPSVSLAGTSAVVSWQAPTSTGASSLLDFSVSSSTGGLGCTAAGTSCVVPGLSRGSTYTFTVTARNASGSSPSSVASSSVAAPVPNLPSGSPFGSFDVVSGGAGSVSVSGWAIDPETAGPIPVHVYIYTSFTDRAGYALTANQGRADIGAAFPGYGPGHGFSGTVPSSPGVRIACVFAINVGVGDHTVLGCKFVTVT